MTMEDWTTWNSLFDLNQVFHKVPKGLCFSAGRAKDSLNVFPHKTIQTWEESQNKFLERFFPITKYIDKNDEITSFQHHDFETWEVQVSFESVLNIRFYKMMHMQIFTQGLRAWTHTLWDTSTTGGKMKNKVDVFVKDLIENMAN